MHYLLPNLASCGIPILSCVFYRSFTFRDMLEFNPDWQVVAMQEALFDGGQSH